MEPSKTLWMGNLKKGTDQNFILEIFNNFFFIEIKILNIRLLFKEENKKGSAFIEFETPEIAKKVLNEYNEKVINGHLLKLNWTKVIILRIIFLIIIIKMILKIIL